jgi:hypothetical protein
MARYFQSLTLLLCTLMVLIKLMAGFVFIDSAVERVELYTQTCMTTDLNCQQIAPGQIQLEEDTSHELQLMMHLLGTVEDILLEAIPPLLIARPLIVWLQAWRIEALYSPPDHPPKHADSI